jgi:iron-sulfur cluster assembly protein
VFITCVFLYARHARCLADGGSSVATKAEAAPQHAITLTDNALSHLRKLQKEAGSDSLLLRVGVKQGGCSGMSYVMDFETDANIKVGVRLSRKSMSNECDHVISASELL